MKNENNTPTWLKWAHKIATAPLKTKLTVGAVAFAFAAAARLAYLQDSAQDPKPPSQPFITPAPQTAVGVEDNTRLLAAYAAIGMDPPPEIMHQSEQRLEAVRAPRP